jgi:hypothetical protein
MTSMLSIACHDSFMFAQTEFAALFARVVDTTTRWRRSLRRHCCQGGWIRSIQIKLRDDLTVL